MLVLKSTHTAAIAIEKGRTERIASKWAGAMEDLETERNKVEQRDKEIDALSLALRASEKQLGDALNKIDRMTSGLRNHKPKVNGQHAPAH